MRRSVLFKTNLCFSSVITQPSREGTLQLESALPSSIDAQPCTMASE